jgi:hypothetical protein
MYDGCSLLDQNRLLAASEWTHYFIPSPIQLYDIVGASVQEMVKFVFKLNFFYRKVGSESRAVELVHKNSDSGSFIKAQYVLITVNLQDISPPPRESSGYCLDL